MDAANYNSHSSVGCTRSAVEDNEAGERDRDQTAGQDAITKPKTQELEEGEHTRNLHGFREFKSY